MYLTTLLGVLLSITTVNAAELADPNKIVIEGDSLENKLDRKLKASGNAILKKGNKTVQADIIEYDQISDELYAKGNVRLNANNSIITGTEMELSMDSNTGVIPNATFITKLNNSGSDFNKNIRGSASLLFIEGVDKKKLENASITTCNADQNDWFINASEIEINERSKTVDATNATLEFKGVPILFSPLVNFSFNEERKSGFLAPSIGTTSRSGFETSVPYYVNLSPTSDATITPRYFSKRGLQLQGEYRYLDENYSGISTAEILNSDNNASDTRRYLVKINHQHKLAEGLTGSARIEKVSDDNYFSDLESLISVTSQVSLPQQLQLDYVNENWNINLITQKFQNLSTSSPYERLPSLSASYSKVNESGFGLNYYETDLTLSITQFERNNDYIGLDIIEGMRFIAKPSIAAPFERNYGYIIPKLSMNLSSYDLKNGSVSSKQLAIPTMSLDSGVFIDRQFKFGGNNFTQTLEPRAFYTYTPYKDQSMLPMFDTGLLDLNQFSIFNENQFTGGDRVIDANQLTLAATSRFIDDNGTERLSGTLAQRFYINDRKVLNEVQFANSVYQSDTTDLFMLAFARLSPSLTVDTELQYNPDEDSTNRATLSSNFSPEPGKLIDASYRLIRSPSGSVNDLKQINIAGQWPIGKGYSTVGRYNYDIKKSGVVEALAGLAFDAGCWSSSVLLHRLSLATTEKPNYTLFFQLELGGLGSLGTSKTSLADVINRNVPGSFSSSDLPDKYRQDNFN